MKILILSIFFIVFISIIFYFYFVNLVNKIEKFELIMNKVDESFSQNYIKNNDDINKINQLVQNKQKSKLKIIKYNKPTYDDNYSYSIKIKNLIFDDLHQIWGKLCLTGDNNGNWVNDVFIPDDCIYMNYTQNEIKKCLTKFQNIWVMFGGDSLTRSYAFSFFLKYCDSKEINELKNKQWFNLDFLITGYNFEIIYYSFQIKNNESRFQDVIYNPNNIEINDYLMKNKDEFWIRQTMFYSRLPLESPWYEQLEQYLGKVDFKPKLIFWSLGHQYIDKDYFVHEIIEKINKMCDKNNNDIIKIFQTLSPLNDDLIKSKNNTNLLPYTNKVCSLVDKISIDICLKNDWIIFNSNKIHLTKYQTEDGCHYMNSFYDYTSNIITNIFCNNKNDNQIYCFNRYTMEKTCLYDDNFKSIFELRKI